MGYARAMPDLRPIRTFLAAVALLISSAATPWEGSAQQATPANPGSYTLPVVFGVGIRAAPESESRTGPDIGVHPDYGWWIDLRLGTRMFKPWLEFTRSEWSEFLRTPSVRASGSSTSYALGVAVSPRERLLGFQVEGGAGVGFIDVYRARHGATDSPMVLFRSTAALPLSRVVGLEAGAQLRHDAVYESSWVWLLSAGLRFCLPRGHCGRRGEGSEQE
jgi:hypothetical protein